MKRSFYFSSLVLLIKKREIKIWVERKLSSLLIFLLSGSEEKVLDIDIFLEPLIALLYVVNILSRRSSIKHRLLVEKV
jgi:hypothetical protein